MAAQLWTLTRRASVFSRISCVAMAQTQPNLLLSYWERSPPLAVLAAARLAGVDVDAKADPKFTKDSVVLLTLASTRFVM